MEIAYWIVAGLLALFYVYAGGLKLLRSKEQLAPTMGWVDTVPMRQVRLIGLIEVLGAVGLTLPPLIDIAASLALLAAIGLLVLQVFALRLHLSRGETDDIWLNVTLVALAAIAIGLATQW